MRKIFSLLVCMAILSACRLPGLSQPQIIPTPTASPPEALNCVYSWATQPLTDLSARLQSAMQADGLTNVRVYAESYGENCLDAQSNKVISFSSLETDFSFSVTIQDLTHTSQMGTTLEQILVVLDGFPPESTPGPQPGMVSISFQSGNDQIRLSFPFDLGQSVRRSGLHGADLLEELQKR